MASSNFPLSNEAKDALKKLDFPVVDAHHHIWGDLATVPRTQQGFIPIPLEAFGLNPLAKPVKVPEGWTPPPPPPEAPAPTPEFIKGMLDGLIASFGTHQNMLSSYTTDDLLQDISQCGVNVAYTVHIECGWHGPDQDETKWCQGIADSHGNKVCTGIVGHVNMLEPDVEKTKKELQAHMAFKNFRGIRHSLPFDPQGRFFPFAPKLDMMSDPVFHKNLSLFEGLNLSMEAWLYGHQIPDLITLVKQFPNTRIILNHFGTPINVAKDDTVFAKWKQDIATLAKSSNQVYAKLSGLMAPLGFSDWVKARDTPWPSRGPTAKEIASSRFGDMIEWILKQFGTERCLFGSNYPVDACSATYGELMAAYVLVMIRMGMGEEDFKKVFADTATKVYRL